MRCISLAREMAALDFSIIFLSYIYSPETEDLLTKNSFQVINLSEGIVTEPTSRLTTEWLPTCELDDAQKTIKNLPQDTCLVVVDHYSISSLWHKSVKSKVPVIAIDDLTDRSMEPDILLNPNIKSSNDDHHYIKSQVITQHWSGIEYIMLRDEFLNLTKSASFRNHAENVRKVLICLGGSDSQNVGELVLNTLLAKNENKLQIRIILGAANPNKIYLKERHNQRKDLELIDHTDLMTEQYHWADLAVGGMGISAYERSAVGLPSIGLVMAENQVANARTFEALGLCKIVDPFADNFSDEFVTQFGILSRPARELMSKNGIELFRQARGVRKIALEIREFIDG